MAPFTRAQSPQTPPKQRSRGIQADTIKKARFFNAWDARDTTKPMRSILEATDTTKPTALRRLKQRDELGTPALRRTRKLSDRLGRKSRISDETCKMLVSPSRNPVRDQLYEAQIEYHHLPIKARQLKTRLKQATKGGRRFKMASVKKQISSKNKDLRVKYGQEHKDKSVDDFWQYVYYTDEAHIDPSSAAQGWILREEGHRTDPENIQERPEKTGMKLHVAAWFNWHEKAEKLEFYNDEEEHVERPKRPAKPRSRKYETTEGFQVRLRE